MSHKISCNQRPQGKDGPFLEDKSDYSINISLSKKEIQSKILIAESESEILSLFKAYLQFKGIKFDAVDSGDRALEAFGNKRNEGRGYQTIVINTDLKDTSGIDVIEKICSEKSNQKVVIVTTRPKAHLSMDQLELCSIEENDIFVMPFKLSSFASALIR